jgi:hypothetical protein
MTQTTPQDSQPPDSTGAQLDAVDEQLAARLVEQARQEGISLVGPDGLRQRAIKLVLEGALEVSWSTIWAMSMATRPAATAATPATAPAPRRC